MKIWVGYGTEHSANLVIIGNFKTAKDAAEAKDFIEGLSNLLSEGVQSKELSENDGLDKGGFSKKQCDFFETNKVQSLSFSDMVSFLDNFNCDVEGDKLIITTDELNTSGFVNTLIAKSARIEIYSAHDYKNTGYGRNI